MRFGPCSLFTMNDSVFPGWSAAKNAVSHVVNIGLTQRFTLMTVPSFEVTG